jgi:site-specific recombinase XerC
MRLAELVNMNVQDLDLTAGEARVYRKGGKWDMVVISSIAIEASEYFPTIASTAPPAMRLALPR